jgi:hypothetical protein
MRPVLCFHLVLWPPGSEWCWQNNHVQNAHWGHHRDLRGCHHSRQKVSALCFQLGLSHRSWVTSLTQHRAKDPQIVCQGDAETQKVLCGGGGPPRYHSPQSVRPSVGVHTCNPSTRRAEAGGWQGRGQLRLHSKSLSPKEKAK